MITIGVGNTGSKLAIMFDESPMLISTAEQDSLNFKGYNVYPIAKEGCGKKFGTGVRLWSEKIEDLKNILKEVKKEYVIIFSSLGGGSGSSSIRFLSEILVEQENEVLIVGILPFKKEVVPPLANAVQSISSLIPIINEVTVMLFDNQSLLKEYGNDWNDVNEKIIRGVNYAVNLLSNHSVDRYSPLTIDQSEVESVAFGGGFLDVSETFLEEKPPKFQFSNLDKETKNVMIAMFVDEKVDDDNIEKYHQILTEVQNKYVGRARNARVIPGIIRGKVLRSNSEEDIDDRAYVTVASGLNIEKYTKKLEKMKNDAIEKATAFSSKMSNKKMISNKDSKILDI